MDAAGPSPKRRRSASPGVEEDGGCADYISALPDAVLGDIISLLPTKEGARTRILASRWRDLWLSAPLNLDCRELTAGRNEVRSDVVSRILSSHRGPGRRLYINTCIHWIPADTVEACLRSAALDNLEELDFINHLLEKPQRALILRFSPTLRVANIGGCNLSDVNFHELHLHFPLLKQLGLVNVMISESSLHSLIAGCPALECLLIDMCSGFRRIRINSPTIRCMAVREYGIPIESLLLEQIVIEKAPCLVRLLFERGSILQVTVLAAPKLETLGFISDKCRSGELSRLMIGSTVIQVCPMASQLHFYAQKNCLSPDLCTGLILWLSYLIKGLCVDNLITVVQTVKILALDMHNLSLDTVIELMRCFPCLEKLYIQSFQSRPGNLWRRKHRNLLKCFDMSLKTLVLQLYRGKKSQINFLTFFVLNAKVLESVTLGITTRNNNEKFLAEQRRKLELENRVSRDAQFHFRTGSCVRSSYDIKHIGDLDLTDPFAHM
ncbi:FBD-associated F-box protein At5g60610-like isoform X1 [Triticum dicoccoides]|uniref:FBD-associated F-box protein At5g60610-like isoform X1 n=1 Tax=Triticum dicoccoides TaxID=85692 RepID=UPI00188EA49E|nr:FBD-associated F-box protein At5g60610-like isoform X1 [Triticum dicoccoides]XP_044379652.1 FBD-associated F-box protein At5g60610-like isoform X1 [Triticum aestivum]